MGTQPQNQIEYAVMIGVETFTFDNRETAVAFAEIAEAHKDSDIMVGLFFEVGNGRNTKIHNTNKPHNKKE